MKTQLTAAYDNEKRLADRIWLTQPMGGGAVKDLTWRDVIVGDEWTTANGLLTPTSKLRRAALEDRYASTLATALEARDAIVWEA